MLNRCVIALAALGCLVQPASAEEIPPYAPGTASTVAMTANTDQHWRFRVMLGNREIGFHEFRVNELEEETTVQINANFNVKILFFNAYSYRHQNEESWRDNCLNRLESVTDDNGEMLSVIGQMGGGRFIVDTPAERVEEEATCMRSFAYWNPAFLDSKRLLNPQTGEIVDVDIADLGNELIEIDGDNVAATRYALEMEEGTISLWYARDNGQWLALEAPAPGGRVLRYEPVELPFSLPAPDKLAQN